MIVAVMLLGFSALVLFSLLPCGEGVTQGDFEADAFIRRYPHP